MCTEDEDYEFKIRDINRSCVRELKNDATTRHSKQKRIGAVATIEFCWRITNRWLQQKPETAGHLRNLEAYSLRRYARQDPFQKEMPMPKETNQSLQWTGRRPIMRRAVVTAKKVVMMNTGNCLSPEVKPSLTILESSDTPHFSTDSSSLGTHQECKGWLRY